MASHRRTEFGIVLLSLIIFNSLSVLPGAYGGLLIGSYNKTVSNCSQEYATLASSVGIGRPLLRGRRRHMFIKPEPFRMEKRLGSAAL